MDIKNRRPLHLNPVNLMPLLLASGFLTSFLPGQASISGSITSKYADSANDFNFSEHLLEGRINMGQWSAWTQLEFSDPPELGVNYSGLRKFRLEYFHNNLSLEFGDVYTIWGRGLLLNQIDDQAIDLDTGVRGLHINYMHDIFNLNVLAGKLNSWKSSTMVDDFSDRIPNYETDHLLSGANLETEKFGPRLGISYLESREDHYIPYDRSGNPVNLDLKHRYAGTYAEYSHDLFDAFVEAVYRSSVDMGPGTYFSDGKGVYAGIGTYLGEWSAVIDYKNYDFKRLPPDKNFDFVNNYDISMDFQRPPTGVYEHTSRLIGRIIHELDPNDEVGTQIYITGPVKEWFNLSLNHSRASRHDILSMNEDFKWNPQTDNRFLSTDSPFADYFTDTFVQIEGALLSDKLQFKVGLDQLEDVRSIITNFTIPDFTTKSYEYVSAQTFPLDLNLHLPSRFSLQLKTEYQAIKKGYMNDFGEGWEFRSLYPVDTKYNTIVSLGVARSPKWSIAFSLDRTSQEWDKKNWVWGPKEWRSIEILYNLNESTRLSVMSGSQQGGLLCSNGVCRYVQDFDDGYKVNVSWVF